MEIGNKIKFTDKFKKFIEDKPEEDRDVLYYVRNDEFEVKDTKEGFIQIVGIVMWGWVGVSMFEKI